MCGIGGGGVEQGCNLRINISYNSDPVALRGSERVEEG
jgi:hypothetical protein